MEIRDSRGRKVSLLNDDLPRLSNLAPSKTATLPPLQHRPTSYFSGTHTLSSSVSSNAGGSPPSVTPSLCRSDSSDSAALHSPSPPTPLSSGFEHLRQALPKRNKSQIEGLPGIASLSRRSSTFSSSSHHHAHLPPAPPSSSSSSLLRHAAGAAARSPMDFSSQPPLGVAADFPFPPHTTLVASPQSAFDPLVLGGPVSSPASATSLSAQQPLPNPVAFDATTAAALIPQLAPGPLAPQPPLQPQQPPQQQQQQQQQNGANGVYPAPVTQQRSQKKNSYPCPLSKQYNCLEFFTTSGHAARHAKKHTGKKDAICPECGKGFTRKDNMEQHRRTHANGRNTHNTHQASVSSSSSNNTSAGSSTSSSSGAKSIPKVTDTDESKARKKSQQQRKARPSSISTSAPMPIQATAPSNSQPSTATSAVPPTIDLLDPALRGQAAFGFSPSSADFGMYPFDQMGLGPDGIGASQPFQAPHAPMRSTHSSQGNASRMRQESRARDSMSMARPRPGPTSPSLAPKLDALALVAEGVRRRDSDLSP